MIDERMRAMKNFFPPAAGCVRIERFLLPHLANPLVHSSPALKAANP